MITLYIVHIIYRVFDAVYICKNAFGVVLIVAPAQVAPASLLAASLMIAAGLACSGASTRWTRQRGWELSALGLAVERGPEIPRLVHVNVHRQVLGKRFEISPRLGPGIREGDPLRAVFITG